MSLPESILNFLDESPVSLVAASGGPRSIAEIKSFYDEEIAPQVNNKKYGQLCYAGLLMAQDYIWEAHEIVQDYSDTESSWWHAFMHRMEGDYGNAAYWYRRVGEPVGYEDLQARVNELELPTELSVIQEGSWDSFELNGFIQKYRKSLEAELKEIHRTEWSVLYEACYKKAL